MNTSAAPPISFSSLYLSVFLVRLPKVPMYVRRCLLAPLPNVVHVPICSPLLSFRKHTNATRCFWHSVFPGRFVMYQNSTDDRRMCENSSDQKARGHTKHDNEGFEGYRYLPSTLSRTLFFITLLHFSSRLGQRTPPCLPPLPSLTI